MEIKVTKKDLIGDLVGFPIEIVEIMLERQYEQIHKVDIVAFQNDRTQSAMNEEGGFRWSGTIEGQEFWNNVIRQKKFDIFFKHYPELAKNVYIHGNKDNGKEVIKELKKRGGINKYDYTGTADALYFIDPVTNYITIASKIDEVLQNIFKTYYTEITLPKKVIELTIEEIAEKFGVDAELLRIKK